MRRRRFQIASHRARESGRSTGLVDASDHRTTSCFPMMKKTSRMVSLSVNPSSSEDRTVLNDLEILHDAVPSAKLDRLVVRVTDAAARIDAVGDANLVDDVRLARPRDEAVDRRVAVDDARREVTDRNEEPLALA